MKELNDLQNKLDEKRLFIGELRENRAILHVKYNGQSNKWDADVISIKTKGYCDYVGSLSEVRGFDNPIDAAKKAVEKALLKIDINWKYEPDMIYFVSD